MKVFTFDAPAFSIVKSYQDDNGQRFIEGIASNIDVDLQDERMSPEVIAKMAARLIGKPLRSEHGSGWDDRLGEIVRADVVKDEQGKDALWIKARLFDWSTKGKDLFNMLKAGVEKIGLSVAGKVSQGGIVKEFCQDVGKWINTYVDVEPTEVSITDHPANLGTFALAVSKSLKKFEEDKYEKLLNKAVKKVDDKSTKPKEYESVDDKDFLDEDNFKYPINEDRLLPALRYFNHKGQREAGDYTPEQWNKMGVKLASRLSDKIGEKYEYDLQSEQVIKVIKITKNIGDNMTNSKLVSKNIPADVASLIKDFGGKVEDTNVKKSSSSSDSSDSSSISSGSTSTGSSSDSSDSVKSSISSVDKKIGSSDSSDSSSDSSDKSSSTSSDVTSVDKADSSSDTSTSTGSSSDSSTGSSSTSTGSEMSSILSDLSSSLNSLKDSLSSISSAKSSSTSSSDSSDSSSDTSTSTGSSSDSVDKAVSSSKIDSASDSSDSSTSVDKAGLKKFQDTVAELKEAIANITKTAEAQKKAQEETKFDRLAKSIQDLQTKIDNMPQMKKSIAMIVDKDKELDTVSIQKSFKEMTAKIMADPEIGFSETHQFKTLGIIPEKYRD